MGLNGHCNHYWCKCVLPFFAILKECQFFVLLEFPQITMQYEICGKINELYKVKRTDWGTKNLSLWRIPMHFEIFDLTYSMWLSHFRLISTLTPKKITTLAFDIGIESIDRLTSWRIFIPWWLFLKTQKFVFCRLSINLLALNQLDIYCNSLLTFCSTLFISGWV